MSDISLFVTPQNEPLGSLIFGTPEMVPQSDEACNKRKFEESTEELLEAEVAEDSTRAWQSLMPFIGQPTRRRKILPVARPYFCKNPANPFERVAEITDSHETLLSEKAMIGSSVKFGKLAAIFCGRPGTQLGKGISGAVWRCDLSNRPFSIKTNLCPLPRAKFPKSVLRSRLAVSEARIMHFLTRTMLSVAEPTLARSPNFVSIRAYELAYRFPSCEGGKMARPRKAGKYACVIAAELFDLGDARELLYSRINPRLVDKRPLGCEKLAFSLIAQTLLAICCMATLGISHNDLALKNIFARETPPDASLIFSYPLDDPRLPTEYVGIKTQGVLFAIGDFGVASCSRWEQSGGDVRFKTPNLEYGPHATLGSYYYGEDFCRITRKPGLILVNNLGEVQHPLQVDVDTLERDVAYFLTTVISGAGQFEESRRIENFARAALAQYETKDRIQSAAQIVAITKRILTPEFAKMYFDAERASDFFVSFDPSEPYCHVYRMPNKADGDYFERELVAFLNSEVVVDSFTLVDGNLNLAL